MSLLTNNPSVSHFRMNRFAFPIYPHGPQYVHCSFFSFDFCLDVKYLRHFKHKPWEHEENSMTACKLCNYSTLDEAF